MTSDYEYQPVSLSVAAQTAQRLAGEIAETQRELDLICAKWGMLSQKMVILTEALRLTVQDLETRHG